MTAAVVLVQLSPTVNKVIADTIVVAAVLAAVATIGKLLWHPRSPFRRSSTWVCRRLVVEPCAESLATWLEAFIVRVVVPRIDEVSAQITVMSARNDAQHAANVERIDLLAVSIDETNHKLVDTNGKLADLTDTLAHHLLANPPLPGPPEPHKPTSI